MFFENVLKKILEKEILNVYEIHKICKNVKEILINEPNILFIESPICVLGDVHGQFEDLLELLSLKGGPRTTKYLFMGDYVDRGADSLNVILLLFCYKILFPKNVYFLRGNHEQKCINKIYGFYDEVLSVYKNDLVWKKINSVLSYLSLSAVIDRKYFCVHGGISNRVSLDKIKRIDRTEPLKDDDILNDLFWSDPHSKLGCQPNQRGSGVLFGVDVVKRFLMMNNLEMVIRSHQLVLQGYRFEHENLLLTIWSAPNYMNRVSNPGVILYIEPNVRITPKSMLIFVKEEK